MWVAHIHLLPGDLARIGSEYLGTFDDPLLARMSYDMRARELGRTELNFPHQCAAVYDNQKISTEETVREEEDQDQEDEDEDTAAAGVALAAQQPDLLCVSTSQPSRADRNLWPGKMWRQRSRS